jgi:hypothetical protein
LVTVALLPLLHAWDINLRLHPGVVFAPYVVVAALCIICAACAIIAACRQDVTPAVCAAAAAAAAADGSALLYAEHILQPATVLLRHLAAVGCEAGRDRAASRDNLRFISELIKRWGSKVALTGVYFQQGCRPHVTLFLTSSQFARAALLVC